MERSIEPPCICDIFTDPVPDAAGRSTKLIDSIHVDMTCMGPLRPLLKGYNHPPYGCQGVGHTNQDHYLLSNVP